MYYKYILDFSSVLYMYIFMWICITESVLSNYPYVKRVYYKIRNKQITIKHNFIK